MNINTLLFLYKYSLAKPGALQNFNRALHNQFISSEELTSLNWKKTQKLLDYVYAFVPYYQRSLKRIGLHPNDISKPEHFEQIPVLHRKEIIENYDLFFSDQVNPTKMKLSTTGGSTGTPLKLAMSPKLNRELSKWQMLQWWGLQPNVDLASLYRGIPVTGLKKTVLDLINWPQHIIRFDATNMSAANIIAFIDEIIKYKPELVHGYVGAVDTIADYLLEHSIEIPAPRTIWLTAAPVTKVQEDKISRAFKAPVCDQYGCSELYFISAECPRKEGLHVFSDSIRLEFLDEMNRNVKKGEYGNLVFTNLDEYGFPLIRYANGDKGRYLQHECSCGMSLPLMDKVKGRVSDNIVLPGGEIISGEYLTTIFDDFTDHIKQFQVIQRKDDSIDINVVFFNKEKQKEIIGHTLLEFHKRVNSQVAVKINVVDNVESIRGKLHFIIKESK